MFRKILVPLDGSALAEQALGPAMALARAVSAEVVLLRSVTTAQPVFALSSALTGQFESRVEDSLFANRRRATQEYLSGLQQRYQCPGCVVRAVDEMGEPAAAIVDVAHERGVDLIVMSTHGQTGMRRAVWGSVTERVLHGAGCPVLVVRSPEPIRRILIALDGSELGERVLPPALAVARALGAQIILLRVSETPLLNPLEIGMMWDMEPPLADQDVITAARGAAERYLADIAAHEGLTQTDTVLVLEGLPAERIEEYVRLSDVDLIAMSTHGRTGLRRWLYGSVTHQVMRGCRRSMLIIRPPDEALRG